MDEKIKKDLLDFLRSERRRLQRQISYSEGLLERTLDERGPGDSFVISEARRIEKIKDRRLYYDYFINKIIND